MAVWSSQTKNASTWSSQTKNLGGFEFILQESGFYLFQETLDKIILEQSSAAGITWSSQNKS